MTERMAGRWLEQYAYADREGVSACGWESTADALAKELKLALIDLGKLVEAIDHLRSDGSDGYADVHADKLVARIRADWSL